MALPAIFRVLAFLALWSVLTGTTTEGLWFGVPAAAVSAALSLYLHPPSRAALRPLPTLVTVPRLLARGVVAGLDIARRALDPHLPVAPGWVRLDPARRDPPFQVFLGGVISILPGTLAAGPAPEGMEVHLLDTGTFDAEDLASEERRARRSVAEPADEGR